jgi:cytochrome c553
MKRLLAVLMLTPLAALAQTSTPPANVQVCVSCHGANGEGNTQVGAPRIAGQPAPYLERQLAAFADGRRDNAIMSPIAKPLSAEQRSALADYYAALNAPATIPAAAKASAGSTGSPANARGRTLAATGNESLHVQACDNCHGPGGTGFGDTNPYLTGLDAHYLVAALDEWKTGTRKTDPSAQMNLIAGALSAADIQAVATYYSTQRLPVRSQSAARNPTAAR